MTHGRHDANPDAASVADDIAPLLSEFTSRLQRGEAIGVDEFAARHPQHEAELKRLLPTARALAGLAHPPSAAPPLVEPQFSTLGDFRLLREIGRGGMGIVYEAEQISLGRRVALKVFPFAGVLDPRQLQRFQNEARAAATLDHPHIVHVHAVGQDRGVHYYAMQLIDGQSLAELVTNLRREREADSQPAVGQATAATDIDRHTTEHPAKRSASPGATTRDYFRQVARWGIEAAEALDYAHQMGIVHRDIKPSNLLINTEGKLWVTDFGLAMTRSDTGLTMTGDLLGTLRYMSPEQLAGQRGIIDQRTDVYSLGMTLYELLALRPAFDVADRAQLLPLIQNEDPTPAPLHDRGVPLELELIVYKAINKDAAARYMTAQTFADDLQRFLNDQPIHARPPGLRQRATKWARRHKTLVRGLMFAGGISFVISAVAAILVFQARRQTENERLARRAETAAAAAARRNLSDQQYVTRINLADRAVRHGDLEEAKRHLAGIVNHVAELSEIGFEWHYLMRLCDNDRADVATHPGKAYSLSTSPDGVFLLSAGENGARVWNLRTSQLVTSIDDHTLDVNGAHFSHDGRFLATSGDDGCVRIWDSASWTLAAVLPHTGPAGGGTFSNDGRMLISGERRESLPLDAGIPDDVLQIWPKNRWTLTPEEKSIGSNVVRVWDTQTWTQTALLSGAESRLQAGDRSDDDSWIAVGERSGMIHVWQLPNNAPPTRIADAHAEAASGVLCIDFAHRHPLFAASGARSVKLWTTDGKLADDLPTALSNIRCVAFSPNDEYLLSSGYEGETVRGSVEIWERLDHGRYKKRGVVKFPHYVWSICFLGVDQFAVAVNDGTLYRCRIPGQTAHQRRCTSLDDSVCFAAVSPDGRWLVRSGTNIVVQALDDPSIEIVLDATPASNVPLVFSPDGKWLLAARADGCHRWEVDGWKPAGVIGYSTSGVSMTQVEFTSHQTINATDELHRTHLWHTSTQRFAPPEFRDVVQRTRFLPRWNAVVEIRKLGTCALIAGDRTLWEHPFPQARTIEVSPDELWLAVANADGSIEIVDARTGLPHALCFASEPRVELMAFSPNGRTLAGGNSHDGRVTFWHVPTGRELFTIDTQLRLTRSLVFTPDQGRLILAGQDELGCGQLMQFNGANGD